MAKMETLLSSTFEYWRNHDLLLKEEDQLAAKNADAGVFPIFDWAELRELFELYENEAKRSKEKVRGGGAKAIICCGIGAALAPVSTIFDGPVETATLMVAGLLTIFGSVAIIAHYFRHRWAQVWLGPRMFAERIRHFYFQFILGNFELLLDVVDNPDKKAGLDERRRADLALVKTILEEQVEIRWKGIDEDRNLRLVWVLNPSTTDIDRLEERCIDLANASPEKAKRILTRLAAQRVSVQHLYPAMSISLEPNSLRMKVLVISIVSVSAMIMVPFATIIGVCGLLTSMLDLIDVGQARIAFAVAAFSAAIGFTARLLEQGLHFELDLKRNREYEAHMRVIVDQFSSDPGNLAKQISALFELERQAYWETRQFFLDHKNEHFFG